MHLYLVYFLNAFTVFSRIQCRHLFELPSLVSITPHYIVYFVLLHRRQPVTFLAEVAVSVDVAVGVAVAIVGR